MVFQGNYLRVTSLRTVDGTTPLIIDGELQYKEDFLPLSAKQFIETQNKDLPEILRKRIEVVKGDQPAKESKTSNKK